MLTYSGIATTPLEKEIAANFVSSLSDGDRDFIISGQHDFGMVGRHIRNQYGLWNEDCPLTENWHKHPEARDLRDGIDFSDDHPDAVSARIVELAKAMIREGNIS
jgi:uncharacterized protein YbdZ (MbtH family)